MKSFSLKWFALFELILFIGVSVAPSIYAENSKKNISPHDALLSNGGITREKMIAIAEAYASFEWYPTTDNIAPRSNGYLLFHTLINSIIQNHTILFLIALVLGIKLVNTPDRNTYTQWPPSVGWKADELNIGVPYQWGGFSSISGFNLTNPEDFTDQYTGTESFQGKIHYAGDINTASLITSHRACGVDCSGFVSRCWNLSTKQSTRTLGDPNISIPITFDSVQMGDILNRYDSHVILFHEFTDVNNTQIHVYEAGPNWKVCSRYYTVMNISEDRHSIEINGSGIYELFSYNGVNER